MSTSSGLEAYFDKKRKKQVVSKKLDDVRAAVDPAFLASFDFFRSQVLSIVEECPEAEDILQEEIEVLTQVLQKRQRIHNLKKIALITEKIL